MWNCWINEFYFSLLSSRGQLGHGVTETQSNPKLIEALETVSMATISCGGWHSAAVSGESNIKTMILKVGVGKGEGFLMRVSGWAL